MTKREMFAEIRNIVADNAEMVAFIDHEIELLERKSNSPRSRLRLRLRMTALRLRLSPISLRLTRLRLLRNFRRKSPLSAV